MNVLMPFTVIAGVAAYFAASAALAKIPNDIPRTKEEAEDKTRELRKRALVPTKRVKAPKEKEMTFAYFQQLIAAPVFPDSSGHDIYLQELHRGITVYEIESKRGAALTKELFRKMNATPRGPERNQRAAEATKARRDAKVVKSTLSQAREIARTVTGNGSFKEV